MLEIACLRLAFSSSELFGWPNCAQDWERSARLVVKASSYESQEDWEGHPEVDSPLPVYIL